MGYPHDKVSTPLNVVVSGFSRIELHKFYIIYVNTSFIIFNTAQHSFIHLKENIFDIAWWDYYQT